MTTDGGVYYHNEATDEVSWEKPPSLQTAEEKQASQPHLPPAQQGGQPLTRPSPQVDESDCAWLPTAEGWTPAFVCARSSKGRVRLRPVDGGATVEQPSEGLVPLKLSYLDAAPDDLVMLEQLDAPLIAHCLQKRYAADKIYTWVGADHSVLISINPFKHLPIYGQYFLERFAAPAPNRDVEPHTYALARRAFRGMMDARRDQAILISGESGAGKTEATKQCLHFLADAAGTKSGVEQRILQANPILEAFGNAKTVRNDNSSRFGRWMEVHFESSGRVEGQIAGAFVESYLLEKSRVVAQAAGERSFHIFYQLCASPRAAGLGLRPASEHRSLGRAGCTAIRGVDDVADFEAVLSSLAAMGLGDDEVGWALRLCAASVHLCDLDFEPCDGGDGSRVAAGSATALAAAAECLGVATSALSAALVERAVVVRGEAQRIRNTAGKADEASAALAKAAYAGLFRDLVRRINAACGGERGRLIGVLDIFGFEIFEANSFEQLCINFANERLQRTFCEHTFENEQASAAPRPHLSSDEPRMNLGRTAAAPQTLFGCISARPRLHLGHTSLVEASTGRLRRRGYRV